MGKRPTSCYWHATPHWMAVLFLLLPSPSTLPTLRLSTQVSVPQRKGKRCKEDVCIPATHPPCVWL